MGEGEEEARTDGVPLAGKPAAAELRPAFSQVQPGAMPGTLLIEPDSPPPVISAFAYGPDGVKHYAGMDVEELPALLGSAPVVWIDVEGLGDEKVLRRLAAILDIHQLTLEDIVHVHQRPKLDLLGDRLFVIARMASLHSGLKTEQIAMLLGDGLLLTCQKGLPGDCLEAVRNRIRSGRGPMRKSGADYLMNAIIDAIVDSNFPLLERFGEELELLEDEILQHPRRDHLPRVHAMKRNLIALRRAIWPLRDVVSSLARDPIPLICDDTRVFLRDSYDHVIRVFDLVETYRELCTALGELYLSTVSHRMNEVMGLLTVVATIFIPLTFVVGVYGMNFDTKVSPWNMPELEWYWGYPVCVLGMLTLSVCMLIFFKRRGWLSFGGGSAIVSEPEERAPRGGVQP